MKLSKLAIGAGLALTIAAFSPAAFAQDGNGNGNYSANNGYTNSSGGYYGNNPNSNYSGSNTGVNNGNAWPFARDVKAEINQARE
jgi:hypothetical protein